MLYQPGSTVHHLESLTTQSIKQKTVKLHQLTLHSALPMTTSRPSPPRLQAYSSTVSRGLLSRVLPGCSSLQSGRDGHEDDHTPLPVVALSRHTS